MDRQDEKTVDDLTREEITELAAAADQLLGAARFVYWLKNGEADEDPSFADSIDRMAQALEAVGLPQGSTAEFIKNVEEMLRSGLPPDQWRQLHDATGNPS